jgi:hypothetical protein
MKQPVKTAGYRHGGTIFLYPAQGAGKWQSRQKTALDFSMQQTASKGTEQKLQDNDRTVYFRFVPFYSTSSADSWNVTARN